MRWFLRRQRLPDRGHVDHEGRELSRTLMPSTSAAPTSPEEPSSNRKAKTRRRRLLACFGDATDPGLREAVAVGMQNKRLALRNAGRYEEALVVVDDENPAIPG
jgi:hypothetical protein